MKEQKIEKETRQVEVVKEEKVSCNMCKKVLEEREPYYEITTHTNSWGNDSIDSYENYDICEECITKFLEEYIKSIKSRRYESYRPDIKANDGCQMSEHNECIEIERKWASTRKTNYVKSWG